MRCIFMWGLFLLVDGALGHPKRNSNGNHNEKPTIRDLYCDVGIVGGGFSGLYMAYEILTEFPSHIVCILEKDDDVGGRIRDHRFKEAPDIDVGLGAWRVDKKQLIMIDFLKELHISYKDWSFVEPHLIESRGIEADNTEDIKQAYPALKAHPKFGNMSDAELWAYVLKPGNVAQAKNFATVNTYLSNMITSEGANYIMNLGFHRGETQDLVNPAAYLELMNMMHHLSGKYFRPDGGMSAIIAKLYKKVIEQGGNIYTNTEVQSITKAGSSYILRTPNLRVKAKKLVVAVPPGPFRNIRGRIAWKIQRTPEFDSILPIPAFKGGALYKTAWWENVKIGKDEIKAGQQFTSQDNCIGASMAHRGYGSNGEGVMHTMYTDGNCARNWKKIMDLKTDYIDEEVHRALEAKYGVKIPKPIGTKYQFWDAAWHFQKSNTPFTLKDISDWAKRPFWDQEIFVVGESYDPSRGWCQGALLSCRYALKQGWEIERTVKFAKRDSDEYRTLPINPLAFLG